MGEYTTRHVERPTVINPLRRRNRDRGLTPEQRDEVQKLVLELVQSRLLVAFGPRGLFTVTPHDPTAVDTFFAQTVADTIAWDVAATLASPGRTEAAIERVAAASAVSDETAQAAASVPLSSDRIVATQVAEAIAKVAAAGATARQLETAQKQSAQRTSDSASPTADGQLVA